MDDTFTLVYAQRVQRLFALSVQQRHLGREEARMALFDTVGEPPESRGCGFVAGGVVDGAFGEQEMLQLADADAILPDEFFPFRGLLELRQRTVVLCAVRHASFVPFGSAARDSGSAGWVNWREILSIGLPSW